MPAVITSKLGCPVVPSFAFLGALGSLLNPFKQKRGTLFHPRLLGSLAKHVGWGWAADCKTGLKGALPARTSLLGSPVVPFTPGFLGYGFRVLGFRV